MKLSTLLFLFLLLFPPQHGKPGVGGSTPSSGQPGVGTPEEPSAAVVASVYDSATAIWCFDDPTTLGDDCSSAETTYDLTPVNTPTATGGATGYALANDGTDAKGALAPDSAALSAAGGDFTVCFWVEPTTVTDDDFYVGQDDWTNRAWHIRNLTAKPTIYTSRSCTTFDEDASTAGNIVAGTRNFICAVYNSSTTQSTIYMNTVEGDTSGTMSAAMGDCTSGFAVAAAETTGTNRDGLDGSIGPVYWWKGEIVSTATMTNLYNSGKGMTCAKAAGVDVMTSCWDLDEDPADGSYVDAVGAENMSPVGTPDRVAGLVDRSDSGMGLLTDETANQYLTGNLTFIDAEEDFSFAYWRYYGTATSDGTPVLNLTTTNQGTTYAFLHYAQSAASGADRTFCYDSVSGAPSATSTVTDTSDGWRLVTGGYQASSNKCWVSTNGENKVYSTALANGIRQTATYIGFARSGSAGAVDTLADNLTIWAEKDLSQDEIADLWAAGAGKFYPEIVDAACDETVLLVLESDFVHPINTAFTVANIDDGSLTTPSFGSPEWYKMEILETGLQDEGPNQAGVSLTPTCTEFAAGPQVTLEVSMWAYNVGSQPEYLSCVETDTLTVTLTDAGGTCP